MELLFIGRDGTESSVAGIPALAALIRGGALTESTLVKNRGEASWQPAARHPDTAALFSLREAQEAEHQPPKRRWRPASVAWFLVAGVGVVLGKVSGQIIASDPVVQSVYSVLLAIFLVWTLARQNVSTSARIGFALLLVAATFSLAEGVAGLQSHEKIAADSRPTRPLDYSGLKPLEPPDDWTPIPPTQSSANPFAGCGVRMDEFGGVRIAPPTAQPTRQ
jgi:hypothetical protein